MKQEDRCPVCQREDRIPEYCWECMDDGREDAIKLNNQKWIEEIEKIIDNKMSGGYYEVPFEGARIRGLSGDLEFVWNEIKRDIEALKSKITGGE